MLRRFCRTSRDGPSASSTGMLDDVRARRWSTIAELWGCSWGRVHRRRCSGADPVWRFSSSSSSSTCWRREWNRRRSWAQTGQRSSCVLGGSTHVPGVGTGAVQIHMAHSGKQSCTVMPAATVDDRARPLFTLSKAGQCDQGGSRKWCLRGRTCRRTVPLVR
jgi:hypothetical protein